MPCIACRPDTTPQAADGDGEQPAEPPAEGEEGQGPSETSADAGEQPAASDTQEAAAATAEGSTADAAVEAAEAGADGSAAAAASDADAAAAADDGDQGGDAAAGDGEGSTDPAAEGEQPAPRRAPAAPRTITVLVPKVIRRLHVNLGQIPEELGHYTSFYFISNRDGPIAFEDLDAVLECGTLGAGPSLQVLEQASDHATTQYSSFATHKSTLCVPAYGYSDFSHQAKPWQGSKYHPVVCVCACACACAQTLANVYMPILLQLSGTDVSQGGVLLAAGTSNSHKELLSNMQKFLSQVRLCNLPDPCYKPARRNRVQQLGTAMSSRRTQSAYVDRVRRKQRSAKHSGDVCICVCVHAHRSATHSSSSAVTSPSHYRTSLSIPLKKPLQTAT